VTFYRITDTDPSTCEAEEFTVRPGGLIGKPTPYLGGWDWLKTPDELADEGYAPTEVEAWQMALATAWREWQDAQERASALARRIFALQTAAAPNVGRVRVRRDAASEKGEDDGMTTVNVPVPEWEYTREDEGADPRYGSLNWDGDGIRGPHCHAHFDRGPFGCEVFATAWPDLGEPTSDPATIKISLFVPDPAIPLGNLKEATELYYLQAARWLEAMLPALADPQEAAADDV
jgi:hypothetical protein